LEGVAFCIANCFDVIEAIACDRKESIKTLRTGESGGSRLQIWRQIITDVLGLPLEVMRVEEPGCLGAALLAGVGIGAYQDIGSATDQAVRVGVRTTPDSKNSTFYEERRSVFNETYRVLEPVLYRQTDYEEAS
jgi:xylulokinase